MSNPTKRPLHFPPWHIPYLEKHRIYELFHELARELIIKQPDDHLLFIKQILMNAAKSRDVARVIFLPAPKINLLELSEEVSKVTKQVIITKQAISNYAGRDMIELSSELFAKCLSYLVRKENCYMQGWIMMDCMRNEEDAKQLLKLGIIPTHTFQFIAPFHPNLEDIYYCKVPPNWPEQRRLISNLRTVYKNTLLEVHVGHRQIPEIAAECVNISKIRKAVKQIKPRVLIIGPIGSGRKTQAELLSYSLKLVPIDFEYLLCQTWISPSELGEKLRECRNEACFHSELLAQVVNKRVLEEDCILNGWVLTGFPFTEYDFKHLDSIDTPPNRVIFLECDLNLCRERLRNKRFNVVTGSVIDIEKNPAAAEEKQLAIHPRNNILLVDAELDFYCQNYGSLRKYCGSTASVVNGDLNERAIHEYIIAIILRAPPAGDPRKGITEEDQKTSSSGSSDVCDCPVIASKVMDCFIKRGEIKY
ncbi:unnamed protein product [Psylliodes chrysocephalus]|uniref:Adenylate kinase 8 n=1 Tax=Psylliodes chrysocephalus TaxID=3402493 RepID=A0A9P0GFD2_9CUCU|nr:unnamed protein product [Psylliodes chrysocephala]